MVAGGGHGLKRTAARYGDGVGMLCEFAADCTGIGSAVEAAVSGAVAAAAAVAAVDIAAAVVAEAH